VGDVVNASPDEHEYEPRNPDAGDWLCKFCGHGRHHPWHPEERN
jgi:hypothetical protein